MDPLATFWFLIHFDISIFTRDTIFFVTPLKAIFQFKVKKGQLWAVIPPALVQIFEFCFHQIKDGPFSFILVFVSPQYLNSYRRYKFFCTPLKMRIFNFGLKRVNFGPL